MFLQKATVLCNSDTAIKNGEWTNAIIRHDDSQDPGLDCAKSATRQPFFCWFAPYKHTTIASTNFYLWFIRENNCLPIFNGFSLHLPCPIHSSFVISGTNERLLACLFPLYPSNLSRLLVLSLTDFWISSPHFSVKTLAGAFRSSFTNFSKCRWSLDVVFGGLPLRFAVWTFPRSRYFLKIVATVPLGLFYNLSNCCSSFCHSHNENMLVFFNFLSFAYFSTLDVLMIYLWLKMVSNAIARTKNLWDRHTSHK